MASAKARAYRTDGADTLDVPEHTLCRPPHNDGQHYEDTTAEPMRRLGAGETMCESA